MGKIKVLHQVLDPSGAGGVSAEFRALMNSSLTASYDFTSMILVDVKPGVNLANIKFYYEKIKQVRPDIVHVRGAAVDGLNAVIAARLAGHCKVLTTVHGMYSDMIYYNPFKKWVSKNIIEYLIFSLSHGISCVCKNATQRLYFDRYRTKMLPYVYNRMPKFQLELKPMLREQVRSEYNIALDDIVCVFVGRMTKEKGLLTIEKMFASYGEFSSKLIFMFVGDGDYRKEFEDNCRQFNSRIIFAGLQNDVQRFYMAADFFLQSSLHENHSIALLEACAAGIPAIATDCGGNSEIISHNNTGIIIPVDDPLKMSEAIKKMTDKEELCVFTQNVRTHNYSQFSNEECDKALDNVYKLLIQL